jgi:hypothetical protein
VGGFCNPNDFGKTTKITGQIEEKKIENNAILKA